MRQEHFRGYLAFIIIICLVVGAVGGALGSFFLKPYMERSIWGQRFLAYENDAAKEIRQNKILSISEDSATIDAVKQVSPAVVSIVVTKELRNFYNLTGPDIFEFNNFNLPGDGTTKREVGGGTGFIFDESGLILTNRHVVSDLNAEYSVILNDGEQYEATVLGRDTVQDIAVLKIDVLGLQTVSLGDSDNLQIGQTVIAIGNTLSEYRNTVTRGVVSGIDRSIIAGGGGDSELIEEAIQTDAAINPGNSGGPLLNLAGEVVGINTAVNFQGQSIGFAIPVNNAKTVVESVLEYGKIVRPWLGVRYVQLDKQIAENNELDYDYGALIVQGQSRADLAIVPDSPADEAGLEENDIILEVNQVKLDDSTSLVKEINKFKPGDEVELLVFQEDKEIIIKVTLTERDSS